MSIKDLAMEAKAASIILSSISPEDKNKGLLRIAEHIESNRDKIKAANAEDLKRSEAENIPMPLLKRLKFQDDKIDGVIQGIKDTANLEDPVGKINLARALDQDLNLYQVSCPIGLIGVIFESRPDALVQISTLCLKSGNAVMLKGGSEAKLTNRALYEVIKEAGELADMPSGWIQLLETREDVSAMLGLDEYINLIIPRGSNAFVKYIIQNSDIPVLGHADGICHGYVDAEADLSMAVDVIFDSKTQYVAVCNALETLLVHESIARDFLPRMAEKFKEKQVVINGDQKTTQIIDCNLGDESIYETEYLDYELSIKVVKNVDEAIGHINKYGSGHTDTIITSNENTARKFMNLVDTGNAFWNCSTRFADGFRYGFGAEVGISTNKIHARGPVGLEGLVIYKYKLIGKGHIVQDYTDGNSTFKHKPIDKGDFDKV